MIPFANQLTQANLSCKFLLAKEDALLELGTGGTSRFLFFNFYFFFFFFFTGGIIVKTKQTILTKLYPNFILILAIEVFDVVATLD